MGFIFQDNGMPNYLKLEQKFQSWPNVVLKSFLTENGRGVSPEKQEGGSYEGQAWQGDGGVEKNDKYWWLLSWGNEMVLPIEVL